MTKASSRSTATKIYLGSHFITAYNDILIFLTVCFLCQLDITHFGKGGKYLLAHQKFYDEIFLR